LSSVVSGKIFLTLKRIFQQADVEVTFDVPSLEKAEQFDPTYMYDAQALCKMKGADVKGGVGPFGLYVLASSDLRERTAVFFRVFTSEKENKHMVLMCNDPTQYDFFLLLSFF
jgi:beta-fructofuranosidase